MQKYIYGIILLIGYFTVHTFFNKKAQVVGDSFYGNKDNPEVYDTLHKLLPNLSHNEWIVNYLAVSAFIPLIINNCNNLLIDLIGFMVVIYLIRDITINLTILPKQANCKMKKKEEFTYYDHVVGICYDKIFSGHFSLTFILTLLYHSYGVITNIPLLVGWNVLNGLAIISTRSHYTIDVVMAFFVCAFIYTNNIKIPLDF
jgi:hypothetical protein